MANSIADVPEAFVLKRHHKAQIFGFGAWRGAAKPGLQKQKTDRATPSCAKVESAFQL
jgi:hypothetical protein